jgi:2-polyprenyl-6-methoxyphenol hydroxylase-like FAD-dependent oxidoreductase
MTSAWRRGAVLAFWPTMTTSGDRSVELLIVGAGPVGLFAGLCAARAGIDAMVVDHTYRGFGRGYATLLHPASVRLLAEAGVRDRLQAGREIRGIGVQVSGSPRVRLELPTPALAVAQSVLEEALLAALRATDVELFAPYEVSAIQQDDDGVRARVARRELVTLGSPGEYSEWQPVESFTVKAKFVIGADGYESRVRGALGLEVAKLGETQSFAMFEVPSHADASPDFELGFSSDGLGTAVVPLPGERARLGFQLASGLAEEPDAKRFHELLNERAPWFQNGVERVDWSSVMHFERRLVRRFGRGRIWLAGDAAHITSPFGSQSMNLGLSEAHDLVGRVAACLRRDSELDIFGQYGSERLREWHKLLGFHVTFELLRHAPPWLGTLARQISPTLPASGADLKEALQQLGLKVS